MGSSRRSATGSSAPARMGVFAAIMTELAAQAQDTGMVMIDATHPKMHRTASSLAVQKGGADG
jgi:glucuronate isomerase